MREYLLDTQVALWILLDNERLSEKKFHQRFLAEPARFVFHQASTWEIQIKYQLGKLPLPQRPEEFLLSAIENAGFQYEPISDRGIFMLDRLPPLHRDPFDRLLVSHAVVNGWTVITADKTVTEYPVSSAYVSGEIVDFETINDST